MLSRTSDHDQYENQTDDHPHIHTVLSYIGDSNPELWLRCLHCRDHKDYDNGEFTVDSVTLETVSIYFYDGSDIGTHGRDCPTR